MDYLADLTVKESCSILEQTTPTKNGGTASCRSAVFFGCEEEEEGRGRERESGRRGEDFERMEEDGRGVGEDGHGTLRREKQGFRKDENQDFEKVKTNSGFLVKCNFGSQHSQHSQHFPLKALRMRKLMGG